MTESAVEETPGPAWSWRADWTEPLRRRPAALSAAAVVVAAVLGWRTGLRPELPAFLYLGCVGVLLAVVDVALRRLPDPLTLPSYPVAAVLLGVAVPFTENGGGRFASALVGLAALWGLFFVQWFLVPRAIGFGDVKLSGVLGLYLGWLGKDAWVLGTFSMFVFGGLYSVGLLIIRRGGRKATIPFGPFMLAGVFAGVLAYA